MNDSKDHKTAAEPPLDCNVGRWINAHEQHAPLYTEVLVVDKGGKMSVGMYLGHGTYSHHNYPVLGQVCITHWQALPDAPTVPNAQ